MHQKWINKNVDYFYKLQINETEHQNHRLGWILAAQALIFTSLCALLACNFGSMHEFLFSAFVPLIVVIGVLFTCNGDLNRRNEAFDKMNHIPYPHITYYGTEIDMQNVASISGRDNADSEVRKPMDWSIPLSFH